MWSPEQSCMPENERADDALVTAFKRGDQDALDLLVARHGAALLAYLRRRSSEAEDLYQESWLRAISHIHRYRRGSFRAWLIVIARNTLIDTIRRRRPTLSLDASLGETGVTLADLLSDEAAPVPETVASQEAAGTILAAVAALPESQREVFYLRYEQGLSFTEIAQLLNIPLNTALGRMHYAVTKLRQQLELET